MSHAQLCPVCGGRGKFFAVNDKKEVTETTCHGCKGKGWVTVLDNIRLIRGGSLTMKKPVGKKKKEKKEEKEPKTEQVKGKDDAEQ